MKSLFFAFMIWLFLKKFSTDNVSWIRSLFFGCFKEILGFNKVLKFWCIWSEVINSLNVCLSQFAETHIASSEVSEK